MLIRLLPLTVSMFAVLLLSSFTLAVSKTDLKAKIPAALNYHTFVQEAESISGLTRLSNKETIEITPNPNDGKFSVIIPRSLQSGVISIHDMTGKNIYSTSFTTENNSSVFIDLNNKPSGVYFLLIEKGAHKLVSKFVIR